MTPTLAALLPCTAAFTQGHMVYRGFIIHSWGDFVCVKPVEGDITDTPLDPGIHRWNHFRCSWETEESVYCAHYNRFAEALQAIDMAWQVTWFEDSPSMGNSVGVR